MLPKSSPSNTFKQPFEQIHHCIVHNWPVHSLWLWELRKDTCGCLLAQGLSGFLGQTFLSGPLRSKEAILFVSFSMLMGVNPWRCGMRLAVVGISIRYEQFLNGSVLTWSVKFLIYSQHFLVVLWLADIICIKHLYWKNPSCAKEP